MAPRSLEANAVTAKARDCSGPPSEFSATGLANNERLARSVRE